MSKTLNRRLYPLLVASFFQGFVLWYAIEKLFMRSIGFNDAQIAIAAIIISAVMLVLQVPSGILADRWSRKGMLIVASIALGVNSAACGLSHSVVSYMFAVSLWGVFYALYGGSYDSIVYDTLIEETGDSKGFEKCYGKVKLYDAVALAAGSLLSGVVGKFIGLRATYFLTIPFTMISIIALIKFREPQLHRAGTKSALGRHTIDTIKAVLGRGRIFWIVLTLVFMILGERIVFEFCQLWYLAFIVPVLLFGPFNALVQSSVGTSGYLAHKIKNSHGLIFFLSVFLVVCSLALTSKYSVGLVVAAQTILITGFTAFNILLSHEMHDLLPSKIRAGSSSTVGMLSQMVFLPVAYLFGRLSKQFTIFKASWVIVAVTLLAVAGLYVVLVQGRTAARDKNIQTS
jgi:MFS family permease